MEKQGDLLTPIQLDVVKNWITLYTSTNNTNYYSEFEIKRIYTLLSEL
jgi:hypothetical protein